MVRTRPQAKDTAMLLFVLSGGAMKNRVIAKLLDVDERKIAVWKHRYCWASYLSMSTIHPVSSSKKRGAPAGNKNALGNKGGAPFGNTNRMIHGAYTKKDLRQFLDADAVRQVEEYAASCHNGAFEQEICALEMTTTYCCRRIVALEQMEGDDLDIFRAQIPLIILWGRASSKRARLEFTIIRLYLDLWQQRTGRQRMPRWR